uniref:Uncharacterized protein n=1 Tax=viral metagenome TaxID=1070528 RepID=A0A6C0E349_9ZZZZ
MLDAIIITRAVKRPKVTLFIAKNKTTKMRITLPKRDA